MYCRPDKITLQGMDLLGLDDNIAGAHLLEDALQAMDAAAYTEVGRHTRLWPRKKLCCLRSIATHVLAHVPIEILKDPIGRSIVDLIYMPHKGQVEGLHPPCMPALS